jgi:hypothetical protein
MSLLEKLREDRAAALETIEGLENEIAPLEQAREFWTQMVADYDIAIAALEPAPIPEPDDANEFAEPAPPPEFVVLDEQTCEPVALAGEWVGMPDREHAAFNEPEPEIPEGFTRHDGSKVCPVDEHSRVSIAFRVPGAEHMITTTVATAGTLDWSTILGYELWAPSPAYAENLARIKTEIDASEFSEGEEDDGSGYAPVTQAEPEIPDGFIPWRGGDCPVDGDTVVDVVYRKAGRLHKSTGALACDIDWGWSERLSDYDVIAYIAYDVIRARSQPVADPPAMEGVALVDGAWKIPSPVDEASHPMAAYVPATDPQADALAKAADYYSPEAVAERERRNLFNIFKREGV